jgi:hypothetical protein
MVETQTILQTWPVLKAYIENAPLGAGQNYRQVHVWVHVGYERDDLEPVGVYVLVRWPSLCQAMMLLPETAVVRWHQENGAFYIGGPDTQDVFAAHLTVLSAKKVHSDEVGEKKAS